MLISTAYAQAGGAAVNPILNLLPLVAIFAIFYFLIIRPQQKRIKDHAAMVQAVRRGDVVVTSGGVVGKVTKVLDGSDEIMVEIAENVRVKVVKTTLSDVRSKTEPVAAKEKPAKDDKPANEEKEAESS